MVTLDQIFKFTGYFLRNISGSDTTKNLRFKCHSISITQLIIEQLGCTIYCILNYISVYPPKYFGERNNRCTRTTQKPTIPNESFSTFISIDVLNGLK